MLSDAVLLPGQKCVRKLDVFDGGLLGVPLRLHRIGCGEDGGPSIKLANDSSLWRTKTALMSCPDNQSSHDRSRIPLTLAIESVCCSMTSCSTDRVLSLILSNSSMQQMPLSLSTSAPVCRTSCRVSGSFITYAVRPTALDPFPDVYWPRGTRLYTYWSSWDLLVPGSPQSRMLISARKFPRPVWVKSLRVPPNNCSRMPWGKKAYY